MASPAVVMSARATRVVSVLRAPRRCSTMPSPEVAAGNGVTRAAMLAAAARPEASIVMVDCSSTPQEQVFYGVACTGDACVTYPVEAGTDSNVLADGKVNEATTDGHTAEAGDAADAGTDSPADAGDAAQDGGDSATDAGADGGD